MEGQFTQHLTTEMAQKAPALSFLGRRSYAPRPLSEATMIFDTDNEEDDSDDSLPQSLDIDNDSQSTLSDRYEVTTPLTGGLGGFTFHFDDTPVKGPVGPHLFRSALDSSVDEDFLSMSPIGIQKAPARPFTSLNTAVAELDESQVRDWSPRQVAEWMGEAGFEACVVEKFLIHDICGSVLLDLQFEDLKELDISSFGKRRRVMTSIQRLRDSSMIVSDTPLSRTASNSSRQARALRRAVKPEESHVFTEARSMSRRGRHGKKHDDPITPAESVSIVAIEQLLPKPHSCSKGENCSKWQKQQRKIQRLQEEFATETKSVVVPSVIGSSDILGPTAVPITAELLGDLRSRDAQENVRQFLDFQHMHSPRQANNPSPPPAASANYAFKAAHLDQHLRGLPRLTIPVGAEDTDSPSRTPLSAFINPTQIQVGLKTALLNDPYHYGGVASPVDVYRVETPVSATDIPVTSMPIDPCQRDVSQSVPPEMRYGAPSSFVTEPIRRCISTQPRRRQPSFTPAVAPVRESTDATQRPVVTNESDLANHSGWMRRRKAARLMRHEWQDQYFNLNGSKLDVLDNDYTGTMPSESIDVDEYTLHAYSTATSSKLSAAFKKSIGGANAEPTFAFSLIPEDQKTKKLFEKNKGHHFAVNSGRDRVEWMRKLMLAKAMKKNDICQI